jgi:uncharacterized membrane protein YbaN (DUF454 family)
MSTDPAAAIALSEPGAEAAARSRPARIAYLALGWFFFGLGLIGAVLPLIPATPFMLLALWAFTRGSTRLEHWLLHHRWFGRPLRAWRAGRVVPLKVKLIAWVSMGISLTGLILFGNAPWYLVAIMAVVIAIGSIYLATCPSRLPEVPSTHGQATGPTGPTGR